MAEAKIIHCPSCDDEVGKYDGRSNIDLIMRCRRCQKRVIYRVDTNITEIKPLPSRACSSGLTFGW